MLFLVWNPSVCESAPGVGPCRGVEPRGSVQRESEELAKKAALNMFATYSRLEEKQEYVRIYALLTKRYKLELAKDLNVKNANDYETLRFSSEARWFNFCIVKITRVTKSRFKFLVQTTIEECGESERVKVTFELVKEAKSWRIDGRRY